MRQPDHSHVTVPDPDWHDLPLGAGQENTNRGVIQHTHDGDPLRRTDIRRKPGDDTAYTLVRPVNGAI